MKSCSMCGIETNSINTYKSEPYTCIPCIKSRSREYYIMHKDQIIVRVKKYIYEHPEKRKQWSKNAYINHRDRILEKHRKYKKKLKLDVLSHYCIDRIIKCGRCGFSDIRSLTIDHVHGGGRKHRNNLARSPGHDFYSWLKKNNYPKGYQVLCMNCQFIKQDENYERRRRTT